MVSSKHFRLGNDNADFSNSSDNAIINIFTLLAVAWVFNPL